MAGPSSAALPFAAGAATAGALWALARAYAAYAEGAVRPMDVPAERPLRVVITGGTRGVGLAMAHKFLSLKDSVLVCGRDERQCEVAKKELTDAHPHGKIVVQRADVSKPLDVEALFDTCRATFGGVDIVVSNAGLAATPKRALAETDPTDITTLAGANINGPLLVARYAVPHLAESPSGGALFFLDGTGAWGNGTPGNAVYGMGKRGVTQLATSLRSEVKQAGLPVGVHMCSPGMVNTRLLRGSLEPGNARAASAVNALAAEPSEVSQWLVPRIRGAPRNASRGLYFRFLTPLGAITRLLLAAVRGGKRPVKLA